MILGCIIHCSNVLTVQKYTKVLKCRNFCAFYFRVDEYFDAFHIISPHSLANSAESLYLCAQDLKTSMNKKIIDSIKKTLASSLPEQAVAMLYGSQARGDARKNSDWDILIILDKERLMPEDDDTVTYPLTKLGWALVQKSIPSCTPRRSGRPAGLLRSITMS